MKLKIFLSAFLFILLPVNLCAQDFWQEVLSGLSGGPTLKVGSSGAVYTLSGSLLSSTDKGMSWQSVAPIEIFSIFGTSPTGPIYLLTDSLRKSTDDGTSWITVNTPLSSPHLWFIEADFAGNIYTETGVLGGGASYRSEDEGVTWIQIGVPQAWLLDITFDNQGNTYAIYQGNLPSGTRDLYKSTNNGDTWTEITTTPDQLTLIYSAANGFLYAAGYTNPGLHRSTDDGATWTEIFNQGIRDIAEASNGDLYIAVYGAGVYKSEDNGTNWVLVNEGLTLLQTIELAFNNDGYLYVLSEEGGLSYNFKIFRSITPVILVTVDEPSAQILTYSLEQNYPNPFNPTTTIRFSVPERSFVTLKVFNILGNEVAELVNGNISAGEYEIPFNASELSSGVYFYKITAGNYSHTNKMLLLK